MGQIQNAVNTLATTAAGGLVAKEVKTQSETLKNQLALSQQQLAVSQKNAADLQEYMGLNDELINDLMNPVVNRDEKKGTSAVKMSQQQAKSKSQQNKGKRQRFEIKKGGLIRL